ncbi:hypothetical protein ABID22_002832 [Pontibacter aydingkolensis]|uniref:DUF4372 domain-containing protein n=1 Tax=Pontibacter aydingkolensis TaxID=1911536 RepID=A0ABS7CXA9_9BACT|nr:hypothetical protein [Pontibacter aydingkolensis]MBW7468420.1 hypothetical protein [Pontibacter aydingkolensis]
MQQKLLSPQQFFRKSFREVALGLVPLYKLSKSRKAATTRQQEYSSPVCYAHLKDMREGFGNQE